MTDLRTLIVATPVTPADPWWRRPGALRAFAYAVFDRGEPAVALDLHAMEGQRPFAVAAREADGRVEVRVVALSAPTSAALARAEERLSDEPLRVGRTSEPIACRAVGPAQPADYGCLARTPFSTAARLQFESPTTFSQGGDLHLPLPVPDLILRSWARRWNAFCPPGLEVPDDALAALASRVGVAQARIETVSVDLSPGRVVGFVGVVTLAALRPQGWTDGERSAFAALTAYSAWCGTGARTTQGLGLTMPEE